MTLRVAGAAVVVGLADSLDPVTVGPSLYLATVARAAWRVMLFAAGVFAVNLCAGVILTIGPGHFLLGLVPRPQRTVKHIVQLVGGVVLLGAAVAVWRGRGKLASRELPMRGRGGGRSALVAGASIAAVQLPTALAYFALIAAIVSSSASIPAQIGLLLVYNVAAVAPILAILLVLLLGGGRAGEWLMKGGAWLQRRWPVVLAGLLLLIGAFLVGLGGTGLVRQ